MLKEEMTDEELMVYMSEFIEFITKKVAIKFSDEDKALMTKKNLKEEEKQHLQDLSHLVVLKNAGQSEVAYIPSKFRIRVNTDVFRRICKYYRLSKNKIYALGIAEKGKLDLVSSFMYANSEWEEVHRKLLRNPTLHPKIREMLYVLYPDCKEAVKEEEQNVEEEKKEETEKRKRLTEEEKRKIVERYKSSGKNLTDFAKENDLNYQNLRNWTMKYWQ